MKKPMEEPDEPSESHSTDIYPPGGIGQYQRPLSADAQRLVDGMVKSLNEGAIRDHAEMERRIQERLAAEGRDAAPTSDDTPATPAL